MSGEIQDKLLVQLNEKSFRDYCKKKISHGSYGLIVYYFPYFLSDGGKCKGK
jgi:hypothetical protein